MCVCACVRACVRVCLHVCVCVCVRAHSIASIDNSHIDDKECPTLDDIPNGSVDMIGVTVGSTATYTCNDNYQLMGASTRMCQPDGTWSGEEPMCIGERYYHR